MHHRLLWVEQSDLSNLLWNLGFNIVFFQGVNICMCVYMCIILYILYILYKLYYIYIYQNLPAQDPPKRGEAKSKARAKAAAKAAAEWSSGQLLQNVIGAGTGKALVGALSSNSILHPVIFWASRVYTYPWIVCILEYIIIPALFFLLFPCHGVYTYPWIIYLDLNPLIYMIPVFWLFPCHGDKG